MSKSGKGQSPSDIFSLLRSIGDAAVRRVCPQFRLSDLPIAVFEGTETLLLRHPTPLRNWSFSSL